MRNGGIFFRGALKGAGRKRLFLFALSVFFFAAGGVSEAQAQDISDVSRNIISSIATLPGLITALSYLLGLVFGVTGVLKLKEHVDNPNKAELRDVVIRFVAGGALFALPIVYEAMRNSIGTNALSITQEFNIAGFLGGLLGKLTTLAGGTGIGLGNINSILTNIITSIQEVPALLSGVAYMLGLILGVSAILKLKEHVENPQTGLRESVIRFLIGGALFALPAVYNAMHRTIVGSGTGTGTTFINNVISVASLGEVAGACGVKPLVEGIGGKWYELFEAGAKLFNINVAPATMGNLICKTGAASSLFPIFLNMTAYLFGIILGIWGLLKLKEHVLNPAQTPVWEAVSRLFAGGMFFALPAIGKVMQNTVSGGDTFIAALISSAGLLTGLITKIPVVGKYIAGGITYACGTGPGGVFIPNAVCNAAGGGGGGGASGAGLDGMLMRFVGDLSGPMGFIINFFCYAAGTILIMIGISRLMKSASEGPRGPGGIGTIMTFLTGGALLSFASVLNAFVRSTVGSNATNSAKLAYSTGIDPAEAANITNVIQSSVIFVGILGTISFIRGLFLVRSVAEGNSQASMMAAMTHLIGGALAVNIGGVVNAVQSTLGITGYGVTFE